MNRTLLARTLSLSAVFALCFFMVGCGNSSTGPEGQQTRDKDPNAKTIEAPGTQGADTISVGGR